MLPRGVRWVVGDYGARSPGHGWLEELEPFLLSAALSSDLIVDLCKRKIEHIYASYSVAT